MCRGSNKRLKNTVLMDQVTLLQRPHGIGTRGLRPVLFRHFQRQLQLSVSVCLSVCLSACLSLYFPSACLSQQECLHKIWVTELTHPIYHIPRVCAIIGPFDGSVTERQKRVLALKTNTSQRQRVTPSPVVQQNASDSHWCRFALKSGCFRCGTVCLSCNQTLPPCGRCWELR